MIRLHVNVDHVATLRQARRAAEPDPIEWALRAEQAGADGITCHLRKDRRHIQDADVAALRRRITTLLNLELSLDPEMVDLGARSGADEFCLVPEHRQEVTTEGGLDVAREAPRLAIVLPLLRKNGARISLFVDPDLRQVEAAARLRADFIELHTGCYANAWPDPVARARELERLHDAASRAHELGLRVNAGHGLNLSNVAAVAALPHVEELNIGHSIVAHAVFVGIETALREMRAAMGCPAIRGPK
jgi:pyridoxine 5-phosphate synthase